MKKMKKTTEILIIILLAMTGCGGGKQSTDDLVIVDVTKSYPEKELILQDFMNVEYIALDDADEFITQGMVKNIGKEIILITNRINDGDIIYKRKYQ
jgi:PBP1b-binding outer membrane lipoprotein LpoB